MDTRDLFSEVKVVGLYRISVYSIISIVGGKKEWNCKFTSCPPCDFMACTGKYYILDKKIPF
jgi:hypothetical protein